MRARFSLLIACSVAAACADDGPAASGSESSSSAGTEGSTTPATTTATTAGSSSGPGSTTATSTSTSADSTVGVLTESSTSSADGSSSSGDTGTTGDESTGTTGEVIECEPTNPDGDPMCGDGTVVAGELCYQTQPPLDDAGTFATRVWAGDLDGDADPDALVLVEYPAELTALLNDGLGNLAFDDHYDLAGGANTGSRDVDVADMDGDTWVDAVVAFASPPSLRVLTNDGGGAFGFPIVTALPLAPNAVAVADLDGDLLADAVVADALGIGVHYGLGNGSFGMAVALSDPALVEGRDLTVHDLDDDGDLDVAVAFALNVAVFLNDGGALMPPLVAPVVAGGANDIAAGDVTGDGVPDILVADGYASEIHVLTGAGDGNFAADPIPLDGRFVVLGDANADCDADVFTRTAPSMFDELTIYAGNGLAFAAPQTFWLHSGMIDMDGADFDGDTLTDILFAIGPLGDVGVSLTEP
jgi:hypothetical protein